MRKIKIQYMNYRYNYYLRKTNMKEPPYFNLRMHQRQGVTSARLPGLRQNCLHTQPPQYSNTRTATLLTSAALEIRIGGEAILHANITLRWGNIDVTEYSPRTCIPILRSDYNLLSWSTDSNTAGLTTIRQRETEDNTIISPSCGWGSGF
jgi:hypothetical protein